MRGIAETLDTAAVRALLRELGEASRAHRFEVAPNPCVGAAVLSGTRVVARGYHEVWGEGHAEVNALAAAATSGVPSERWDTLVVTLEPCSTSAKTGPCVEAILATPIRTVVVGELDPDPRHRGRGLQLLRDAGLEVVLLEGVTPLSEVAPHFVRWTSFERLRRPRPWTIAKWAQTLSGQLSPPAEVGDGRWIASPESLAAAQVLRGRVDAIVTGIGTVLEDDPRLSVRPPGTSENPPLRIVLDSYLRTPPEARLFERPSEAGEVAGSVHILSLAGADSARARALEEAGARVHGLHGADRHRLRLRDVQTWLWDQGLRRVLLEAGPSVLGSYFEENFLDQLRVITGSVRGGRGASLGPTLASAHILERRQGELGADSVLEGFLAQV